MVGPGNKVKGNIHLLHNISKILIVSTFPFELKIYQKRNRYNNREDLDHWWTDNT